MCTHHSKFMIRLFYSYSLMHCFWFLACGVHVAPSLKSHCF